MTENLFEKKYLTLKKEIGNIVEQIEHIIRKEIAYTKQEKSLLDVKNAIETLKKKWQEEKFIIAVIALAKSGKSTLINSWLGKEYLPSNNRPETARIVRICHRPKEEYGVLKEDDEILEQGVAHINERLKHLNEVARNVNATTPEKELLLEASLVFLKESLLGEQGFDILDTPGPNEAGVDSLRNKVNRILEQSDVILYLLDYTKLKTEDEAKMLEKISQRPEMFRRNVDRLFFIVNKIDAQNRNGLEPKQTSDYVANILNQNISNFNISPSKVALISAEQALLARLILSENPSSQVISDFDRKAFGEFPVIDLITDEVRSKTAQAMLKKSGMDNLETTILSYIFVNKTKILVTSLLDDLDRSLAHLRNHFKTADQVLQMDIAQMESKVKSLKSELDAIKSNSTKMTEKAKSFKKSIETFIYQEFNQFKEDVNSQIKEVIRMINSPTSQAPARAKEGYFDGVKNFISDIGDFFFEPIQKIKNLVTGNKNNQKEISDGIAQLNKNISFYLIGQFGNFRHDLENELLSKQKNIFKELSEEIKPLMRKIEERVQINMKIKLEPVNVRIPESSLKDLHQTIEKSINEFIRKTSNREVRYETKTVQTKAAGWCSDAEYSVEQVPVYINVDSYTVDWNTLQKAWNDKIEQLTKVSVLTANKIIDQQIVTIIDRGCNQIQTYADSFISIIEREIAESKRGETERNSRLNIVKDNLDNLESINNEIQNCKTYLESE